MKIVCKNKVKKLIIYDSFSEDIKELSRGISEDYFLIGDDKHNNFKDLIKNAKNLCSQKTSIDELQIIAHGSKEGIYFANELITLETLKISLSEFKKFHLNKIILWCCNLGINDFFVSELQFLTGAEIFSSKKIITKEQNSVSNSKDEIIKLSEIIKSDYLNSWKGNLNWYQIGEDIDGENQNDNFGKALSLSDDGTTIAVGAINNNGGGTKSGSVRIYKKNDNSWVQLGEDIDGETTNEASGGSISLSSDGTILAIGSEKKNIDSIGNKTGVVRVFKFNNNSWEKIGSDIEGEAAYDYFGNAVKISSDGEFLVAGAKKNDGNNSAYTGQIRVYKNVDNNWIQIGSDINGDSAYSYLGYSVDISSDGSIIAAGAYKDDGTGTYLGSVKVFQNQNDEWVQVGSTIFGSNNNDLSGYSLSLSSDGSVVAIGSISNDDNGEDSGHVRIFKNNNGSWQQIGESIEGQNIGDNFGNAINLSSDGTFIAIGANLNDSNGNSSGNVRVFQNNNNKWEQIGSSIDGDSEGDSFGDSLAITTTGENELLLAIGGSLNDGNGNNSGHVRLFKFDEFDPTLKESNPLPGAKNISVLADISLKFSENIFLGSGSIYLKKESDDSVAETIDISSSNVTGFGSKTILVNLSNALDSSTKYYLLIDNTAFKDAGGNLFTGIDDKTSISFTTADIISPKLTNSSPENNSANIAVDSDIELTFSESVDVEIGKIYIKKVSDDSLFEEIDVTSSQVAGTGTNVITINPANDFASTTQYYVQIDPSVFDDSSGNSFAGISDKTSLDFIIEDLTPPLITNIFGEVGVTSTLVVVNENNTNLGIASNTFDHNNDDKDNLDNDEKTDKYIGFSWADFMGTWASGSEPSTLVNIKFKVANGADLSSEATSIRITSREQAIGYNLYSKDLTLGKEADPIPTEPIVDELPTNSVEETTEIEAPILSSSAPADDAANIAVDSDIKLTFLESVDVETGKIYIKKVSDDSLFEEIDVTSSQVTGTGTNVITINPANDFASTTQYYVQIEDSAFDDSSGNSFAGISDKTSLNFTSAPPAEPYQEVYFDDAGLSSLIVKAGEEFTLPLKYKASDGLGTTGIAVEVFYDSSVLKAVEVEDALPAKNFSSNETVFWSIINGDDASKFNIDSLTGELSFIDPPDFEEAQDLNKDNEYLVTIEAIDLSGNKSQHTVQVQVQDVGEKESFDDKHFKLSYQKVDNLITPPILFTPLYGTLKGDLTLNKLSYPPTLINKSSELSIGKTGINFQLSLGNSAINDVGRTVSNINPLLDGLTITDNYIAYFSYTETEDGSAPMATTLTYDPIEKAGARFYDLSGDGIADTVNLELVDGGYGDKDGLRNGTILDPSTAGVVDLKPIFKATKTALTVTDEIDTTSPAAFNLRVSITKKAKSVNQIGYVALNSNQDDSLTYDLIKDRGSIIISNVENKGAPDISGMNLTSDISLINTQKIVLFEIVDTTLESLLANNTNLEEFGSSFNILNISDVSTNSANAFNGGNTIAISLQEGFSGVSDLIASDHGLNPILDFTGFAGLNLEGSISVAREAKFNSTVGFYKIQNSNGAVLDPLTGALINPDSPFYRLWALHSSNLFSPLGVLSTTNGKTTTSSIASFSDAEMIAPYASIHDTGQFYFSFAEANTDKISHFREFGNGVIGLEDKHRGGDNDFDDLIFGLNLKLTS